MEGTLFACELAPAIPFAFSTTTLPAEGDETSSSASFFS
jgi:hypothetical protein